MYRPVHQKELVEVQHHMVVWMALVVRKKICKLLPVAEHLLSILFSMLWGYYA